MAMNGAGTTIAVGSSGHDGSNGAIINSGHVRVFDLDDEGNWLLRGEAIEGEFAYDNSGTSVVLSANGMIVGIGEPQSDAGKNTDDRKQIDFGQVRVFKWMANESKWVQRGEAITGETKYDFASDGGGLAMDESGTTIAIGSPYHDGDELYSKKGLCRIFDWNGTNWIQRGADLLGEAAGDLFGEAVTINGSGDTVAVGALHNDGEAEAGRYGCVTCRGSVRVFDWSVSGEEWLQRGNDIDGEQDKDFFGSSVALNAAGNVIVIGSPQTGDSSKRGAVDVYEWNKDGNGIWQKRGSRIEGASGGDVFGSSVSISNPGDTIAVGAYLNDGSSGDNDGLVRVYDWNTDTKSWSQRGADIEGENKYDSSGYSVALSADGTSVASGARDTDDGAGYQAGHVRVFGWNNDDSDSGCPENIDPKNFAPVFCEGIEYDNSCIAKAAGFMDSQCTEGDSFCLDDVDPVWCKGSINIQEVRYSNLCEAMAAGFGKSQCTGQDPSPPDECEDDDTFRKGRQQQNCAAFLQNNGERKCNRNHQGKKVYDFCAKTCNEFGLGDCTDEDLDDDDSDDYNFELD